MSRRMWDEKEIVKIAEEHGGGGGTDTSKLLKILIPGPDGLLSEEDRQYVGPGSVVYFNGKISFFGFWGSQYGWDEDEAEYFAYDYLVSWPTDTVGYLDPQRIAVNRRDGTIGGPWGWGAAAATGHKLKLGNTEMTEEQMQALLALLNQ